MCNEFFCPNCRRHKPIELKSTRKSGNSFLCTGCETKLTAKFQPKVAVSRDGKPFNFSPEHVRTSRIRAANKNTAKNLNWVLAHCT